MIILFWPPIWFILVVLAVCCALALAETGERKPPPPYTPETPAAKRLREHEQKVGR